MTREFKKLTPVPIQEMSGRVIHSVSSNMGWTKCVWHKSGVKVPGKNLMPTYDLECGSDTFLVLDNYGDDLLQGTKIGKKLFFPGPSMGNPGWTIAINKGTGEICKLGYFKSEKKYLAAISPFTPSVEKVPAKYLPLLDTLKSVKRPFSFTLTETSLIDFVERNIGWRTIEGEGLVLCLFLHGKGSPHIELGAYSHRVVGCWE